MPNWMHTSFGKVFLINVLPTQRLKSSSFDEHMNFHAHKAFFFEEWMNVYMPLSFYLYLPLHSMLLIYTVSEDTK